MTGSLIVALVNLVRLGTMLLQVEAFVLAIGVGNVLGYTLDAFYGLLPDATMAGGDTTPLVVGLVVAVVAAPVWWWHWLRQGAGATRDTLWHAYVLLVAIFGGLVTAVTATGIVLGTALQWLIGEPEAAGAAAHFVGVPTAVATGLVGFAIWCYHRTVLDAAATGLRTEQERTYNYLAAGVGLVTGAAGATVAIAAAIRILVPGALAVEASGRNTLAPTLTLLIVGLPVWWAFWHRVQGHVTGGAEDERSSPSRRVYLSLLFGATGLVAVVSLSLILFMVFRDLLDGALAVTVLHDLRIAIGLVLTAGGLSAYHWRVQARTGRTPPRRRRSCTHATCCSWAPTVASSPPPSRPTPVRGCAACTGWTRPRPTSTHTALRRRSWPCTTTASWSRSRRTAGST